MGPSRWLDDSTYTVIRAGSGREGRRPRAGRCRVSGRESVLIPASRFVPKGATEPLDVEDYEWSADHSKLLIFTNSARVWRANTRGDFWVLDVARGKLQKLGGAAAKPSTLQFAKFSPDGKRVAYVREHNIYVESLADGAITPLTTRRLEDDHQRHVRLGVRGRAEHARRVPLEPGRQAHRLLAARRVRRARLPAHQQHRLALLVHRFRSSIPRPERRTPRRASAS